MARIFLALSGLAMLLLVSNLFLGIFIGDFGRASAKFQAAHRQVESLREQSVSLDEFREAESRAESAAAALVEQRAGFWIHIWLGITAALVTLLVNSISVTYFIGTSRWCREVVEAYGLDTALAERSNRLKRSSFPWALTGILTILAISLLGAAADPVTGNVNAADWVVYHWMLAMVGVVIIGVCFTFQMNAIQSNYELINEILAAAEQVRERRKEAIAERAVAS